MMGMHTKWKPGDKRPRCLKDWSKEVSRTKQSHKDECDIHKILSQYSRTGLLTHVAERPPFYVDVSGMPDYRSALNAVKEAEELFMELPAKTRSEFDNDPAVFLDFCNDPQNEDKMRELGLLPRHEAQPVADSPPPEAPPASDSAADDQ